MPRLLLSCFITVLLGTATIAEDVKLPGPKIALPEVEGFTKGKTHVYKEAEFGYSVSYVAPHIVITLYVYNMNQSEIPDGAKSEKVKDEMKRTVGEIEQSKKNGTYKSVKEIGAAEIVSLGKGKDVPAALRRQFLVERTEGEKFSDAFVTGYKDHFIKFRITYDLEEKAESNKKIATFLEAVGSALK